MNFKEFLKGLAEGASTKLTGTNGDKLYITHECDYIYSIRLNKTKPREFLITEAVQWLYFYESKRGYLKQEQQISVLA